MSELLFSSIWCAGQVVLLAGFAVGIAVWLTKRRPELACRTTSWAVVGILALTAMIPVPLPDWHVESTPVAATSAEVVERPTTSLEAPQSTAPLPTFQINLARLTHVTSTIRSVAPTARKGAGSWWVCLLLVGVSIGLVRVGLGLLALWKLRRSAASLVQGEAVWAVAESLTPGLGVECDTLRLAESGEVGCAAVVGFFRPTILLATGWREWEPRELRAVLAHEFAHVVRRDALWRFLAVGAGAFHFFNPLVHWLTSRMVLAQELAADRLAIKSMGQGAYVRSLSRLALRQDTSSRVWTQPLFTPVFAGHLMRRIEMLRAKDCERTRNRRWLSSAVLASLVMLGLTTTIARSAVQTQDGKPKADGKQPPIVQVSATADRDRGAKPFAPFQRTRVPASHPMFCPWGALHVNVAPLMEMKPLAKHVQAMASQPVAALDTPPVDASALDSIMSSMRLVYGSVIDADGSVEKNRISFMALGFSATTRRDVDWEKVLPENVQGAVRKSENDLSFWEAPNSIMNQPMRLMAVGKRELAIWFPQLTPGKTPDKAATVSYPGLAHWGTSEAARTREWASEWDAVTGGVLTAAWSLEAPLGANTQTEKFAFCGWEPENHVDFCAWGFDISPDCRKAAARLRIRCRDGVSGADVRKQLEDQLTAFEQEVAKLIEDNPAKDSETERMILEWWSKNPPKFGVESVGDREVVTCAVEISISEAILEAFMSTSAPAATTGKNGE